MTEKQNPLPLTSRDLSLSFGSVQAVRSVSLTLDRGEVLALIGRNGAGKSSLLSLFQGARVPDKGDVSLFGLPADSVVARRRIGIVLQQIGFPEQLTPREVLQYAAAHFPQAESVEEMIVAFQLDAIADKRIEGFSLGMQRRIALALAFVGRPEIVFLDEPTAGLDVEGQRLICAQIGRFCARGGSVVLTSHVWQDIETLADRIAVLKDGAVILEDKAANIRTRLGRRRVSLSLPHAQKLPAWFTDAFSHKDGRWNAESRDSDKLVQRICASGLPFENLTAAPVDLRQIIDSLADEPEIES